MKQKAQQNEIKDNKILSLFSKIPTDLINKSINDFQKISETINLSQTNHFFNHTLAKALRKKKEARKKEFYEAIVFENLFKTVKQMHLLKVEAQKAYCVLKLIEKFLNKKYSPFSRDGKHYFQHDEYTKVILAHAYDLDKKNKRASQLGEYVEFDGGEYVQYYPYLYITQSSPGQERLSLEGLNLSKKEIENLAETYRRYYPNLSVDYRLRDNDYDISFDFNNFLKDVLPVILGLSPKPALLPACSGSVKP